MSDDGLERDDLQAALEARRDLGAEYDAALVDSFADRIERAVEARFHAQVAHHAPPVNPWMLSMAAVERERSGRLASSRQFALGLISCVVGIPVTAITASGSDGSVGKLAVAWIGIVGVNVAHAVVGRRRP